MSEANTPDQDTQDVAGSPDELLVRTFAAIISESDGDGRTIEGKVIPYSVRQRVADPPDFTPYDEEIMFGAFRASQKAPNRVLLDFEHYGAQNDLLGSMGSIAGTLGWGIGLQERDDGLYGQFRIGKHTDGDKALELLHAGVLTGFSAAYKPLRSVRTKDGVVQRLRAHLDRVSLCRVGAYEESKVLAVRTQALVEEQEPLTPFNQELAESLERFGIVIPEILKDSATQ